MPSKRKDPPLSENLFVSEQGEPLCFYLRPGSTKRELLPLITAGGGLLCNVQKPGTILLIDPEERASITESTSHWYVSTKYILDCTEKKEKLNIEEYRLSPDSTFAKAKTKSKVGSPAISGGRSAYTPEEDDAILSYVSKHVKDIGGNRLWQEMAKQKVTSHTWQSMKYRYRVQLAQRLSEYKQPDSKTENKTQSTDETETENKTEGNESPQNILVETEDPMNISSDIELTQVSQSSDSQEGQADAQPSKNDDDETCESMDTSKSEIDETPEQQQPPPVKTTAKSAPNSNNKTLPSVVNRPVTRQQVELENVPYVKKLRSGTSRGSLFKCFPQLVKPKPVSSPKRDSREAQVPPKKVRREDESSEAVESQEEIEQSDPPEKMQADEVNVPAPVPTEKKTAKRKLGILEMATKEFEDDSESDSDLQHESPGPSTSIEAVIGSSNSANPSASTSENQEKEADTTQPEQNPQHTSTTATIAVTSTPNKASTSDPAVPELTTRGSPPPVQATSMAHLFIFENDSQELEEECQSLVGPSTSAAVQTNGHKNCPSLTQDQLEEDVQLLKDFMKRTNQDLVSVTKALLKASGDVVLAFEILQNPSSFSGPVWTRADDQRLCSSESDIRQDLLSKYGEESVAKRLLFLEIEG